MGYGLPAALAMKTLYRDRTVVCIAGDGDFMMTGNDFATAAQYDLPIVVVSGSERSQTSLSAAELWPGAWLVKPIKPRDLVAIVRDLTQNHDGSLPPHG